MFTPTVITCELPVPDDGDGAASQDESAATLQLSVPVPLLVIVNVLVPGTAPFLTAAKDKLVGLRLMVGMGAVIAYVTITT